MTVFKDVMPHDEPKGTPGQGYVYVDLIGGGDLLSLVLYDQNGETIMI